MTLLIICIILLIIGGLIFLIEDEIETHRFNKLKKENWQVYSKIIGGHPFDGFSWGSFARHPNTNKEISIATAWKLRKAGYSPDYDSDLDRWAKSKGFKN